MEQEWWIKNRPEAERPHEKLLKFGSENLSNVELLAIFFRTGVKNKSAIQLASEILQAFGVVRRKRNKSLRYKIETENLFILKTDDINKNSLGIGALRRDGSIFYDDYSLRNGEDED